jgi:hypothetical protein
MTKIEAGAPDSGAAFLETDVIWMLASSSMLKSARSRAGVRDSSSAAMAGAQQARPPANSAARVRAQAVLAWGVVNVYMNAWVRWSDRLRGSRTAGAAID